MNSDSQVLTQRRKGPKTQVIIFVFLCILSVLVVQLISACQPATPGAVESASAVQAKLLATVFMSPTPNEAEQQATRLANRPTLNAPTLTPAPSATVYVGIFLEGESSGDEDMPFMNPNLALEVNATPIGAECPIPIDEIFGTGWMQNGSARQALGCPVEVVIPFVGSVQVFERGVMYYQPNGTMWAIAPGGAMGGHYWALAQLLPPVDEQNQITPPEGLFAPILGFGAMWYGVSGIRDALGFATTQESSANIAYQRFEGGTLVNDGSSGQVFILVGGNQAYGPY
jgi:hypothetical protein